MVVSIYFLNKTALRMVTFMSFIYVQAHMDAYYENLLL